VAGVFFYAMQCTTDKFATIYGHIASLILTPGKAITLGPLASIVVDLTFMLAKLVKHFWRHLPVV
jgi:hypothetical protein